MTKCGATSCVGSVCVKPAGHPDSEHRSQWGSTWTDESDRRYADQIANSMKGKRD